jgi:hypothetical protein
MTAQCETPNKLKGKHVETTLDVVLTKLGGFCDLLIAHVIVEIIIINSLKLKQLHHDYST